MDGLVSLLDQRHHDRVEVLFSLLEDRCGLRGIRMTPYPHFSWQVAESFDRQELPPAMTAWAQVQDPFFVHTSGMGIFSGSEPVLYLPIIRSRQLNRLHAALWEQLAAWRTGASPLYRPEAWMPHITLAFGDVTRESLSCAVRSLARQTFEWQIKIDNLALLLQSRGQKAHLGYRFDFQHAARN
jgi:2'-5' RNA ligase